MVAICNVASSKVHEVAAVAMEEKAMASTPSDCKSLMVAAEVVCGEEFNVTTKSRVVCPPTARAHELPAG